MRDDKKNFSISNKIIDGIKKDISKSSSSYQAVVDRIVQYVEYYEDDASTNIDPSTKRKARKKRKDKNKSVYRSKMIRGIVKSIIANIESPLLTQDDIFLLSKLRESSAKDSKVLNSKILNYQWKNLLNKNYVVNAAARKFAIEGTCIVRVGWKTQYEVKKVKEDIIIYARTKEEIKEVMLKAQQMGQEYIDKINEFINNSEPIPIGVEYKYVEKNVLVKNHATLDVKDNTSIIIDPDCGSDFSKAKFLVEVNSSTFADIYKEKDMYFNLDKLKASIEQLDKKNNNDGFADGYGDGIEKTSTESFIKTTDDLPYRDKSSSGQSTLGNEELRDFVYSDVARKRITITEYWGYVDIHGNGELESVVITWANDILIRASENPYSHKKIPYVIGVYELSPNSPFGVSEAVDLIDDQKGLTLNMKAIQNITAENANTREYIDSKFFIDEDQKNNHETGDGVIYFKSGLDPKKAIYRSHAEPVPDILFKLRSLYNEEASYKSGYVHYDSTGRRDLQNASGEIMKEEFENNREREILRRFISVFEQSAELIINMNQNYLLSTDTYEMEDDNIEEIGDTDRLQGDFKISISVMTPKMKSLRASRLMKMFEGNTVNSSPELTSMVTAQIAELWGLRKLSDKIIEDLEAGPSEQEQMMQQLEVEKAQLENKKLQLEIAKLESSSHLDQARAADAQSKAQERGRKISIGGVEADIELVSSKAEMNQAEAEKYGIQAELFSTELLDQTSGAKRDREIEDAEFKHEADKEREKIRTERELNAIERKKDANKDGVVTKKESRDYLKNYILAGARNNESYKADDDVFRNIYEKNSVHNDGSTEPQLSEENIDADI